MHVYPNLQCLHMVHYPYTKTYNVILSILLYIYVYSQISHPNLQCLRHDTQSIYQHIQRYSKYTIACTCIYTNFIHTHKNYWPTLGWNFWVYAKPASNKKKMNFIWSKLGWRGDYSRAPPSCFANQWIVQDVPSLSSQSKHTKNTIHWFGVYTNTGYPELE